MRKYRVINQKAAVYKAMNVLSQIVAEIPIGEEVNMGKPIADAGTSWAPVKVLDGVTGYIIADVPYFHIREVIVAQPSIEVRESPTSTSRVMMTLHSGEIMLLAGTVKQGDIRWVEVRTKSGKVGFILGDTTKCREITGRYGWLDSTSKTSALLLGLFGLTVPIFCFVGVFTNAFGIRAADIVAKSTGPAAYVVIGVILLVMTRELWPLGLAALARAFKRQDDW